MHTTRTLLQYLLLKSLFLVALFASPSSASATHIAAGRIDYQHLGNDLYQVSVRIHRDCYGAIMQPDLDVYFLSVCDTFTRNFALVNPGGTEISMICSQQQQQSSCNGGGLPGTELFIYSDTVTMDSGCNMWEISTFMTARNIAVNVTNNGIFYLDAEYNSNLGPHNSAVFNPAPLHGFYCEGVTYDVNLGVQEADGDSIVYSLIDARININISVNYWFPHSGTNPIPGITLDSQTGVLSFTAPSILGSYIVVVKAEEYDANGNYKGYTIYDTQFIVLQCTNSNPDLSSSITNVTGGTLVDPNSVSVCHNGTICFDLTATDPNLADTITLEHNIDSILPGATISIVGTNPITATVCWTAQPLNGAQNFTVAALDNFCPIRGFNVELFDISVTPSDFGDAGTDTTICLGDSAQLMGSGGATYSWSPTSTLSNPNIANPFATPTSLTTYYVTVTDGNGCTSVDSVSVDVDSIALVMGTLTQSNNSPLQNTRVYLVQYFPMPDSVSAIDSTFTDNAGDYLFATSEPIVYVKAAPDSATYPNELPTYHDTATVFQNALPINTIYCDTVFISFPTIAGVNPGGPGFIGGYVYQGAGKKAGVGDPVYDLDLVLINGNGQPVQHTVTDGTGYFSFPDIPYGSYTIWVDHPPIENQLGPDIEVGADIDTDTLNLLLQPNRLELTPPTNIVTPDNRVIGDLNIYPNPFREGSTIKYTLEEEADVTLEVYNIIGEKIMTYQSGRTVSGTYEYRFNPIELGQAQGIFIVQLKVNDTLLTKRMIGLSK